MEEDRLDKDNNGSKEKVNPYQSIILDECDRDRIIASQIEQWSILSNIVDYVQYDRNPRHFYKVIDQKYHMKRRR